ncbi:hypothetical protein MAH1_33460 [Sessilibacter sp. MAH1]
MGNLNPQILSSVEAMQQATMTSSVIKQSGAGKAYQSISQSTAIAVQDAADNLRNISNMGAVAMGVAMSQMLATGDVKTFSPIIEQANTMIANSAANFTAIGQGASAILKDFSVGD